MKKSKKILRIVSFWLMAIGLLPFVSMAQTSGTISPSSSPMLNKLQMVGGYAGYDSATDQTTLLQVVGTTISVGLSLLGVIFIILILIAGYNRMTSRGDEEKITKSNQTIRTAIIGLLIIVSAYAIWMFISKIVLDSGGEGAFGGS